MRGEPAQSKTHSDMIKHTGKWKQTYIDHQIDQLKLTCIIHGPGNSPDEFKVLNNVSSKYTKVRPSKEHRHKPAFKKIFGKEQDKNYMVQHAVDEIILQ